MFLRVDVKAHTPPQDRSPLSAKDLPRNRDMREAKQQGVDMAVQMRLPSVVFNAEVVFRENIQNKSRGENITFITTLIKSLHDKDKIIDVHEQLSRVLKRNSFEENFISLFSDITKQRICVLEYYERKKETAPNKKVESFLNMPPRTWCQIILGTAKPHDEIYKMIRNKKIKREEVSRFLFDEEVELGAQIRALCKPS